MIAQRCGAQDACGLAVDPFCSQIATTSGLSVGAWWSGVNTQEWVGSCAGGQSVPQARKVVGLLPAEVVVLAVFDELLGHVGASRIKAEVLEVKDGSYKIHYEGYSSSDDVWITPAKMRRIGEQSQASH